ncbi:MAG: ribonuclease H-like domain-containing protein [Patescibacteria group bacterium]
MTPKILLFDIETSPLLAYVWGMYEQNVIKVVRPWYFLCFAYKWLGEGSTKVIALPDFKLYSKAKYDDYEVVKKLRELLDQADIVIAHNGDKFDIKKFNTRCLEQGIDLPSPFRTIDTLKVARSRFSFTSNKLDSLGEALDVGRKVKTGGFELWDGCINGDERSWRLMKKYNKQDVDLLEKVYLKLRPTMLNHPNVSVYNDDINLACPNCGLSDYQKRGYRQTNSYWYNRYQCTCGAWFNGKQSLGIRKPLIDKV